MFSKSGKKPAVLTRDDKSSPKKDAISRDDAVSGPKKNAITRDDGVTVPKNDAVTRDDTTSGPNKDTVTRVDTVSKSNNAVTKDDTVSGLDNDAVTRDNVVSKAQKVDVAKNDTVSSKQNGKMSPDRRSRADSFTSLYGTSASGYEMDVQQSDMLKQTTSSVTSKLDSYQVWSQGTYVTSIDAFLDVVAAIRLRNMPHKGSKWDKILLQSVFFTSQVHHFEEAARDILIDSARAASLIYGCVHAMLEVFKFSLASRSPNSMSGDV